MRWAKDKSVRGCLNKWSPRRGLGARLLIALIPAFAGMTDINLIRYSTLWLNDQTQLYEGLRE